MKYSVILRFCFLRTGLTDETQLLKYRILVSKELTANILFLEGKEKKIIKILRDMDALIYSTNYR